MNVFANHFTFFQMPSSHILCYLIPSETGNTEAELVPLLTDTEGIRRAYAIPPGALHPEQEHKQRAIAELFLPPAFKVLLRATKDPFVQAIIDRTILTEDASFVIRPHTASSTSKGIANAFALCKELVERQTLSESLENWQISELDRGRSLMSYGQGLGGRSQGR